MLNLFIMSPSSLLYGLLAFAVIALAWRNRNRTPSDKTPAAASPLRRLAIAGPLVILAVLAVTELLPLAYAVARHLAPPIATIGLPPEASWWAFLPVPAAAALVGVAALIIVARRRPTRETPVIPVSRRGWLTFTSRRDLITAIVALGVFVATVLIAGAASALGPEGLYTRVELPASATASGSATFYGWGYSLPVLVAIVVLATAVGIALRLSAHAPFLRPDTVEAETAERRDTATVLTRILIATVLLSIGAAWQLIGSSGGSAEGFDVPGMGMVWVVPGWSSFSTPLMLLGTVLQATAIVLLLVTARAHTTLAISPAPAPVVATAS